MEICTSDDVSFGVRCARNLVYTVAQRLAVTVWIAAMLTRFKPRTRQREGRGWSLSTSAGGWDGHVSGIDAYFAVGGSDSMREEGPRAHWNTTSAHLEVQAVVPQPSILL